MENIFELRSHSELLLEFSNHMKGCEAENMGSRMYIWLNFSNTNEMELITSEQNKQPTRGNSSNISTSGMEIKDQANAFAGIEPGHIGSGFLIVFFLQDQNMRNSLINQLT